MSTYGQLVFKLAVIHGVFEMQELAALLRERTEFQHGKATLYNYLKDKRTPPRGFSDQVRRALGLSDEMYHLLLYEYDRSTGNLSPAQREQIAAFERMLLEQLARKIQEGNGRAAN